jgi:hypothetical protein
MGISRFAVVRVQHSLVVACPIQGICVLAELNTMIWHGIISRIRPNSSHQKSFLLCRALNTEEGMAPLVR